jgi:HEAT repeat protein
MDRHNDPRSTDELISLALNASLEDDQSEISKQGWDAIRTLNYRANREVLDAAHELCLSEDPSHRRVGADILGQLGIPDRTFPKECLGILLGLLNDEDLEVLDSACIALGHLHQLEAIEPLIKLKNHPEASIRYAVTFGLLAYEDERAVKALIELSEDEDDEVRDWATFGLGSQIDSDTPEIRDALYRRLTDSDDTTSGEGMVGLARRKDERVLQALLQDLARDDAGSLPLEAAEEFADPRLLSALIDLKRRWANEPGHRHISMLDSAIEACSPQNAESK